MCFLLLSLLSKTKQMFFYEKVSYHKHPKKQIRIDNLESLSTLLPYIMRFLVAQIQTFSIFLKIFFKI